MLLRSRRRGAQGSHLGTTLRVSSIMSKVSTPRAFTPFMPFTPSDPVQQQHAGRLGNGSHRHNECHRHPDCQSAA